MTAIEFSKLAVEEIELFPYTLEQIACALRKLLLENYAEIDVQVTDCIDLTKEPYCLAAEGLGGDSCVVQVGDPAYVIPDTDRDKLYNFEDIAKVVKLSDGFIIGCGGGPWPHINYFSEMVCNAVINENVIKCYTKNVYTEVDNSGKDQKKNYKLTVTPPDERRFSVLGSLFCSKGIRGKVLKIHCKHRVGSQGFSVAVCNSLNAAFEHPIALGVIFETLKGIVKHHVAPGFAKGVTNASNWLNLNFISAPMISVGTIISKNPEGYSVLREHFHSYTNDNTTGGHYHYDTTPDIVEYQAYVAPARTLFVIDKAEKPTTLF